MAAVAVAGHHPLAAARRRAPVARFDPWRLCARPRMARAAARLLALLAFGAVAPASAQLRLVEVPIAGRASLDSLARLGFEVADVRIVDGAQRAVLVVSPETELLLGRRGFKTAPLTAARITTGAADTFRMYRSFDRPGDGIRATLAAWAAANSAIHVDSVGASYEGR